jgi:hypothetical protein
MQINQIFSQNTFFFPSNLTFSEKARSLTCFVLNILSQGLKMMETVLNYSDLLIKKAICQIAPKPKENLAAGNLRLEPQTPDISYFS